MCKLGCKWSVVNPPPRLTRKYKCDRKNISLAYFSPPSETKKKGFITSAPWELEGWRQGRHVVVGRRLPRVVVARRRRKPSRRRTGEARRGRRRRRREETPRREPELTAHRRRQSRRVLLLTHGSHYVDLFFGVKNRSFGTYLIIFLFSSERREQQQQQQKT